MGDNWIAPDQIFDGQELLNGFALRVQDGRVTDLAPPPAGSFSVAGLVTPGFVDLQVNGGGGVMLNSTPTPDGIATISKAHRRFGTVALLPTVITDAPDVLDRAAVAAIAARDQNGVLGLHIEGPHIALDRRGTHAGCHVRPMDDRTMDIIAGLRQANVRVMVTLAPEAATPDQITTLAAMGAVVSLGHTNATAQQVTTALQAGATCATHLFNAMSPMQSREPGAVGAVINSECYSGIICDGHHVADAMVGLALRARPVPDRMFLVSDAMATVGGPPTFDLYDQVITLKDGQLINTEGSLAGAHVTQAVGVARLVSKVGVSLTQALRMAISTPAACIGAPEVDQLIGRKVQDVIVLDSDLALTGALDDIPAVRGAADAAV